MVMVVGSLASVMNSEGAGRMIEGSFAGKSEMAGLQEVQRVVVLKRF